MISFPALPLRALALLLVILACYVALTPVSAVQTDDGQVQAMMQASQQSGFGWAAEFLRNACTTGYAGVQSCNETGFVTSIVLKGAITAGPPPAFSGLVALRSLKLTYTLNGTLPSSWSSLTQLETLVLGDYDGRLTGALPASWSAMTELKTFEVWFVDPYRQPVTPIASTPPSWLGNLESVSVSLAYWPNSVLPASIGTSTTLKNLKLFRCNFKGAFPSGLITNTHLETLDFAFDFPTPFGTGFTFPSDVSGMTNLTKLAISGGSFTGSLPAAYPPKLALLALSRIPTLTGTIPQAIVDHPTLTSFTLGDLMTGISGPLRFPSNPTTSLLTTYTMSDMSVTGTIPSSVLGLSLLPIFPSSLDPSLLSTRPLLIAAAPKSCTLAISTSRTPNCPLDCLKTART